MALEITETHKKVLEHIAREKDFEFRERFFSFVLTEDTFVFRKTFRNYAHELLNNGYLSGDKVERDNGRYYELKLTETGEKIIRK